MTFDLIGKRVASHTEACRPGGASFRFSDGWFDARQRQRGAPHGSEGGSLLKLRLAVSPSQLQDTYRKEGRNRCEISGSETKATS